MGKIKIVFLGFVFLLVNFGLPVRASARFFEECRRRDAMSIGQRVLLEKETRTRPFIAAGKIGIIIGTGLSSYGKIGYLVKFPTILGDVNAVVSACFLRPIA